MAFEGNDSKVFRTVTVGDHILAKVLFREGGSSSQATKGGGDAPSLLLETYEAGEMVDAKDKDGKDVKVPKAIKFVFYDLNGLRDYDRRIARAKGGMKGGDAAHKYVYAEVVSINPKGYAVFSVKFSDNKADMGEMLKKKGGAFYVLHEAERQERPSTTPETPNGAPAADDDDNIPFG